MAATPASVNLIPDASFAGKQALVYNVAPGTAVASSGTAFLNTQVLVDPSSSAVHQILTSEAGSGVAGLAVRLPPSTNTIGTVLVGNTGGTAFASASRGAATYNVDVAMTGGGVEIYIDATVIGVGGSITVTVFGKDPASGNYVSILASTAIATTGTSRMAIHAGLTASANVVANSTVPSTIRVQAVVAVAACTFSVGYDCVP